MTRNLKSGRLCGFDKIPNNILKIPEIHVHLFNMYKLVLTMWNNTFCMVKIDNYPNSKECKKISLHATSL